MKTTYWFIFFLFGLTAWGGCKKWELPPPKCSIINFKIDAYAQTGPIDSVEVFLQRSDIENGETARVVVKNSINSFNINFCGPFKYRVQIYNSIPDPKYTLWAGVNEKTILWTEVTNNMVVEGYYIYE